MRFRVMFQPWRKTTRFIPCGFYLARRSRWAVWVNLFCWCDECFPRVLDLDVRVVTKHA